MSTTSNAIDLLDKAIRDLSRRVTKLEQDKRDLQSDIEALRNNHMVNGSHPCRCDTFVDTMERKR